MSLAADLGLPVRTKKYTPSNLLVMPTCLLGVEFEYENVVTNTPPEVLGFWEAKRDGSLRGHALEFVFSEPMFGTDVLTAIDLLCKHAIKSKFAVSVRTGLHVHVNMGDVDINVLKRVCALYALFEPIVYDYVGNNRSENVFCLPWSAAHAASDMVKRILNSKPAELRSNINALRDAKYAGLNLDSLSRFGSIEFRHALSTTDYASTLDWINICLRFKEAAVRLDVNATELLRMLSSNGLDQFGATIFQEQWPILIRNSNIADARRRVWDQGVPIAIDILESHVEPKMQWDVRAKTPVNPGFCAWLKANKKEARPPHIEGYQAYTDFFEEGPVEVQQAPDIDRTIERMNAILMQEVGRPVQTPPPANRRPAPPLTTIRPRLTEAALDRATRVRGR
jgi:hypothetical protein